eukprot:TRINITY_DN4610_c0_g1_i2.p1 TRINITY_DN4610_c0_g1~~TRINITY_DN4610_c0_g1_i2.p1  ORF type:complete len:256 (-),score=67.91 TRINITY_DN4610_c0_g1_i2:33-800(-)
MSAAQRPAVPERFSKLVGPNESFLCSETFTTGDRQTTLLFTSQKYYALVLQAEVYKKLWVRDLREIQSVHAEPGSSTLNIKYLTRWHEHNDYLQTRTFEAQHASDPYLCFSWKVAITAQLRAIWQATLESCFMPPPEVYQFHMFVLHVRGRKPRMRCIALSSTHLYSCGVKANGSFELGVLKVKVAYSGIKNLTTCTDQRDVAEIVLHDKTAVRGRFVLVFQDKDERDSLLEQVKIMYGVATSKTLPEETTSHLV